MNPVLRESDINLDGLTVCVTRVVVAIAIAIVLSVCGHASGSLLLPGCDGCSFAYNHNAGFHGNETGGNTHGPVAGDYTFIGQNPGPPESVASKWEPGPNTASAFIPPNVPSPPGPMTPGGATWSFMPAGLSNDSGHEGEIIHGTATTMAITSLGVPGFTLTEYIDLVNEALNTWASVSEFTNLGMVADGGAGIGGDESDGGHLGDIRIGVIGFDNDSTIAHTYQPGTQTLFGNGGTLAGDMHLDFDWPWEDDAFDTGADPGIDLLTVVLHEFGHALGLGHSDNPETVMYQTYLGAKRSLHADDIAGIRAIYGVPLPASSLAGISLMAFYAARRRRS